MEKKQHRKRLVRGAVPTIALGGGKHLPDPPICLPTPPPPKIKRPRGRPKKQTNGPHTPENVKTVQSDHTGLGYTRTPPQRPRNVRTAAPRVGKLTFAEQIEQIHATRSPPKTPNGTDNQPTELAAADNNDSSTGSAGTEPTGVKDTDGDPNDSDTSTGDVEFVDVEADDHRILRDDDDDDDDYWTEDDDSESDSDNLVLKTRAQPPSIYDPPLTGGTSESPRRNTACRGNIAAAVTPNATALREST